MKCDACFKICIKFTIKVLNSLCSSFCREDKKEEMEGGEITQAVKTATG